MTELDVLTIGKTTLCVVQGDITKQHVAAVVNAANSALSGGGGVDGAIHRAAGAELVKASSAHAPLPTGGAIITPGFKLPATYVIHAVGPVWYGGAKGEARLLANTYENSLRRADEHSLGSIAFPAISTGIYGYPIEPATRIALSTTIGYITAHPDSHLTDIIFVCYSARDYDTYRRVLSEIAQRPD